MPKQTVAGQKAIEHDLRAKKDAIASKSKQSKPFPQRDPSIVEDHPLQIRKTRQSPTSFITHNQPDSVGRPPLKFSLVSPNHSGPQSVNGVRSKLLLDEAGIRSASGAETEQEDHSQHAQAGRQAKDDGGKRVLRSQGSTRGTSELELFFTDFDVFMTEHETASDLLTPNSVLYLKDDQSFKDIHSLAIRDRQPPSPKSSSKRKLSQTRISLVDPQATAGASLAHVQEVLDLSGYEAEAKQFRTDPLADEVYETAHKRGERTERKLRNVEKERAMHEKVQLSRLYDELRGPDWLKTMGVSGITETEKKGFEVKRDHYVLKVRDLLGKFDHWRDKEKEMRLKKERAASRAAEQAELEEEEEEEEKEEEEEEEEVEVRKSTSLKDSKRKRKVQQDESALQLQKEASLAEPTQKKMKLLFTKTIEKQQPEVPFTSFFAKLHERHASLGRHRHGRRVIAFGQSIPEIPEEDVFVLPDDMMANPPI